jgi:hypothetical protein
MIWFSGNSSGKPIARPQCGVLQLYPLPQPRGSKIYLSLPLGFIIRKDEFAPIYHSPDFAEIFDGKEATSTFDYADANRIHVRIQQVCAMVGRLGELRMDGLA